MNPAADFLVALGQALAGLSLYAPDHIMRISARERVVAALRNVLPTRGVLRFTFLHDDAIVGTRVMSELRSWDWSRKLQAAGIQRIEIDAVPPPTEEHLAQFMQALHLRLYGRDNARTRPIAVRGLRAGLVAARDEGVQSGESPAVIDDGIDAERDTDARAPQGLTAPGNRIERPQFVEEADAVRWIHNEAATNRAVPLAEAEGVVNGLAAAMHREQHVIMPLLELKSFDQYTTTHSCNVSMLALGLAEQLGFAASDVRAIGTAALLHDIGKVKVPVEILVKPGRLTEEEMDLMRAHTTEGARMLGARGSGHALAAVVAYEHHVWEQGNGGYPSFIFPRRCHYASRIVHVCDLYDALSTRRPYREAWPRERTLGMLRDRSDIEVDRDIVDAFVALLARVEESRDTVDDTPQNDWTATVSETARQMVAYPSSQPLP